MCMVSMVTRGFEEQLPKIYPWVNPVSPSIVPLTPGGIKPPGVPEDTGCKPLIPASQDEVTKLRNELEELKKVLKAAKIYDDKTGQPDCEMDEKIALLRTA